MEFFNKVLRSNTPPPGQHIHSLWLNSEDWYFYVYVDGHWTSLKELRTPLNEIRTGNNKVTTNTKGIYVYHETISSPSFTSTADLTQVNYNKLGTFELKSKEVKLYHQSRIRDIIADTTVLDAKTDEVKLNSTDKVYLNREGQYGVKLNKEGTRIKCCLAAEGSTPLIKMKEENMYIYDNDDNEVFKTLNGVDEETWMDNIGVEFCGSGYMQISNQKIHLGYEANGKGLIIKPKQSKLYYSYDQGVFLDENDSQFSWDSERMLRLNSNILDLKYNNEIYLKLDDTKAKINHPDKVELDRGNSVVFVADDEKSKIAHPSEVELNVGGGPGVIVESDNVCISLPEKGIGITYPNLNLDNTGIQLYGGNNSGTQVTDEGFDAASNYQITEETTDDTGETVSSTTYYRGDISVLNGDIELVSKAGTTPDNFVDNASINMSGAGINITSANAAVSSFIQATPSIVGIATKAGSIQSPTILTTINTYPMAGIRSGDFCMGMAVIGGNTVCSALAPTTIVAGSSDLEDPTIVVTDKKTTIQGTITLGSTTITEEQLKALLALLPTT